MPHKRFDLGTLKKPERMPNGWLRVDGFLTRTGVFTYRNQDGTERRELRLPEEVFHSDALDSFALVPVTNDHPPDFLTAENTKDFAVGAVGERVAKEDDHVRARMLVFDAKAIADLQSGKQQVSCGYTCELEEKSGDYQGQRYDVIQRQIRGNHVALVEQGRAGPSARVRMDAKDAFMLQGGNSTPPPPQGNQQEKPVKKIRIDGVEYEVTEQVAQAFERNQAAMAEQIKRADAEAKTAKAEAEKVQAKADGLAEELKKAKEAHKDATDPAKVREVVKARVDLERMASQILGEKVKLDGLTDREIKVKVIQQGAKEFKADGKSDDYVQARFDQAVEFGEHEDALSKARRVADSTGDDEHEDDDEVIDSDAARKKMIEGNRSAWKQQAKQEARK